MASITFSVEISELENNDLDGVEKKLLALFGENKKELPGSVTDVSEITRDEDDEDEESDD